MRLVGENTRHFIKFFNTSLYMKRNAVIAFLALIFIANEPPFASWRIVVLKCLH